jgi:hypothetical protein
MIGAYLSRRSDIASILDPRCYSIEWLDQQLATGRMQLWANGDAVLITELRHYPAGAREIHAMVASGSLEGISELRERAEEWARGLGVEFASAASRPGWERVLGRFGYELHQVEMRKEL